MSNHPDVERTRVQFLAGGPFESLLDKIPATHKAAIERIQAVFGEGCVISEYHPLNQDRFQLEDYIEKLLREGKRGGAEEFVILMRIFDRQRIIAIAKRKLEEMNHGKKERDRSSLAPAREEPTVSQRKT